MIDDDEKLVALVGEYLEPQGFELLVAHDGQVDLALAASENPVLVILDLMLPLIDGLEICRRVRHQRQVPILMLTARGDETDRIVALSWGQTIIWPSRSTQASCWLACGRFCGASRPR